MLRLNASEIRSSGLSRV